MVRLRRMQDFGFRDFQIRKRGHLSQKNGQLFVIFSKNYKMSTFIPSFSMEIAEIFENVHFLFLSIFLFPHFPPYFLRDTQLIYDCQDPNQNPSRSLSLRT